MSQMPASVCSIVVTWRRESTVSLVTNRKGINTDLMRLRLSHHSQLHFFSRRNWINFGIFHSVKREPISWLNGGGREHFHCVLDRLSIYLSRYEFASNPIRIQSIALAVWTCMRNSFLALPCGLLWLQSARQRWGRKICACRTDNAIF